MQAEDRAAIEAVLLSHPGVAHAVVAAGEDGSPAARVVPALDADDEDSPEEWGEVFDELYSAPDGGAYRGWTDRVTGAPIPAEHMEAWRLGILERVRELGGRRLLEVGAGEGLLVSGLVAEAREYWATEVSDVALSVLAHRFGDDVVRRRRAAHDTSGLPPGHFDVVLLNSVAQYFPHAQYLATVLGRLAALLAPGGAIVVGDVRALALGQLHHDRLAVARARADVPAERLAADAERALAAEAELLVDPAFFDDVVAASGVLARAEVALPEHGDTEMGRYRYDAVLYTAPAAPAPAPTVAWGDGVRDLVGLYGALADRDALVVTGVPNPRLARDLAATAALRAARGDIAAPARPGPDPAVLTAAARAAGFRARAVPAADPYRVDLLAHRPGSPPPAHPPPAHSPSAHSPSAHSPSAHPPARRAATTNRPMIALDPSSSAAFADGVRAYAAARLPPPLVPTVVTGTTHT